MPITVERRDAKDVYNLPLFDAYIVIDVRNPEHFASGHIYTALSFTVPPATATEEEQETALVQLAMDLVDNGPEKYGTVVLYGYADGSSEAQLDWVVQRLRQLQESGGAFPRFRSNVRPTAGDLSDADWLRSALNRLCEKLHTHCTQIWLVDQGFEGFAKRFPHMIFQSDTAQVAIPPVYCCEDFLYLGSRAFKPTPAVLTAMGITHIIAADEAAFTPQSFIDAPTTTELGFCYLRCNVPDRNDTDMGACWDATTQFIQDTAQAGGRVLLQLHGRSRSASVAIAFYMDAMGLGCREATARLLQVCKKVDVEMTFQDQLRNRRRPALVM
jgi:rhodanese-related sulfurtransferase|uniref:protein-tyrosine-phosphatase n=1 Tax=Eutreptiella gymnastica TaxID=73025 RepID=A0A7S4FW94_9EUGL